MENAEKTLQELIPAYYMNKSEEADYKKLVETQNAEIKECFNALNIDKYDIGEYHAVKSVSVKETFRENALIDLFSQPEFIEVAENAGIIKTRQYVDYDALEKVIYNGEFSQPQLMEIAKCKDSKEIITLRVTKKKGVK